MTIYASTSYPQDDATGQKWADFVASLVHGPEIARVRIFLQPSREIRATCGRHGPRLLRRSRRRAVRARRGRSRRPDRRGDRRARVRPPRRGQPREQPVAGRRLRHEALVDHGAASAPACAPASSRPGTRTTNYERNPGEAYAEAYRVLNERKLGLPETPWEIVDETPVPGRRRARRARAGRRVAVARRRDPPLQRRRPRRAPTRSRRRSTAPCARRFAPARRGTVEILGSSGTRLANGPATASATVCGDRSVRVRVTRPAAVDAGRSRSRSRGRSAMPSAHPRRRRRAGTARLAPPGASRSRGTTWSSRPTGRRRSSASGRRSSPTRSSSTSSCRASTGWRSRGGCGARASGRRS